MTMLISDLKYEKVNIKVIQMTDDYKNAKNAQYNNELAY